VGLQSYTLTGEERAEQGGCEQSRQKLYWSRSGCEQSGWRALDLGFDPDGCLAD